MVESSTFLICVLFHLYSCALLQVGFNLFCSSSKLYEKIIKPQALGGSYLGSTIPSPVALLIKVRAVFSQRLLSATDI